MLRRTSSCRSVCDIIWCQQPTNSAAEHGSQCVVSLLCIVLNCKGTTTHEMAAMVVVVVVVSQGVLYKALTLCCCWPTCCADAVCRSWLLPSWSLRK